MPAKTRHRQTKGMSALTTQSRQNRDEWRAKLLAAKQRPDAILMLANIMRESFTALMTDTLFDKKMRLRQPIDWETTYSQVPTTLIQVIQGFTSRQSPIPTEAGQQAAGWFLDVAEGIEETQTKLRPLVNPGTETITEQVPLKIPQLQQLRDRVKGNADVLKLELRSCADNIKACLLYSRLMKHLLEAGKQGDDKSLLRALGINPQLVEVDWVADRLARAVQTRDRIFLRRLEQALRENSRFQKLGVIGLVLQLGWDAGLKKLSFTQLQALLKEAGFQQVPGAKALEKYAQRLGLKKYYIEDERPILAAR